MSEIEEIKSRVCDLEDKLDAVLTRNEKVSTEKAWETSIFRVILITAITYILTAIVFYIIGVKQYLLSAIIPTLGYYLSTQSLPFVKNWWIEKRDKQLH